MIQLFSARNLRLNPENGGVEHDQTMQWKAVASCCRTGNEHLLVRRPAHAKTFMINHQLRAPSHKVMTDQLLTHAAPSEFSYIAIPKTKIHSDVKARTHVDPSRF